MPKFIYKAKRKLHDIVEGNIEAVSREDAVSKLFEEGLFPITINPAVIEEASANKGKIMIQKKVKRKKKFSITFGKKISSRQILLFTQKLAILIRAKVELLPALRIIYEQTENEYFKNIILEIYNAVEDGKSFSESLSRYPITFPYLYVNIIKSGEAAGALDTALGQINDFLSREEAMRTKIAVALAYPSLLLTVGVASIFVLINFVVPRLKPIFAGLGEQMPFITKVVLSLSELSGRSWLAAIGIAAVLFLTAYSSRGKGLFKELTRKIKVRIPIVRKIIRNQEIAHLSRSLNLLLKRGIPALRALEIVTPAMENPRLQKELGKVFEEVAAGKSLAQSMALFASLPDFFTKMIAVGEETGQLAEVLDEITASYNQQVESDIAVLGSLMEPVLILFLGLILGTIVLSILIPTFQVTQMVR